jgi:transposase
MNLYFVNLEGVRVLGIDDEADIPEVHIELVRELVGCPTCGVVARVQDRRAVRLIDLSMAGRKVALVWNKRRFICLEPECDKGTWSEVDHRIAAPRLSLTDRAGRWATFQVGRVGRDVRGVAKDLGCDWHTVNEAVLAYGEALIEHPGRFGDVSSLGLDEHLMVKTGERHHQNFVTTIVDVARGQLLDVVPDRTAKAPKQWLKERGSEFCAGVTAGAIDLSATYKSVFDDVLPHATLVADPFHVIKHANSKVDECRRRVQNEALGHRGRKVDPLYKSRRMLTMAAERLDVNGKEKLLGLLKAGDRFGHVQATWTAKEALRELYDVPTYELAASFIDELIRDMADEGWPPEVRSLGRTLKRWRDQIIAWHQLHITNGPTESMNNLAKRVKRVAFGFRSFKNYRIRALLYAGKPDWSLLATVTPR